jgi:hypothetical protein
MRSLLPQKFLQASLIFLSKAEEPFEWDLLDSLTGTNSSSFHFGFSDEQEKFSVIRPGKLFQPSLVFAIKSGANIQKIDLAEKATGTDTN